MVDVSRGSYRWWALCLPLIVLALCLTLPVSAQGAGGTISQASLRLWPEYDDPGLLVILSGSFTGTTSFPQKVAFPIAPNARGIQATVIGTNGELLSQPWEIVNGKLTYTLSQPDFQIEYYLERLPSGNQREVNYTFEAPYAMQALEISIQQPARATGFAITPPAERSTQGGDGFTYYLSGRTNLAAGDKLPFSIRYTKTDQGLSVAQTQLNANPPANIPAATGAAAGGAPGWLAYVLIGLGLGALAGTLIYWYVIRDSRNTTPSRAAARLPAKVRPSNQALAGPPLARPAVFCTQCGHSLQPNDRFCAQCGTPRKN